MTEQEIRTVWNREDLTQPVSIGRAFEDVEWCLGEIERRGDIVEAALRTVKEVERQRDELRSQLEAVTRERDEISNDLRLAAGELLVSLPEPGSDASRVLIANRLMRAERNAALKREGRLREALERYGRHIEGCYSDWNLPCNCGFSVALAGGEVM